MALPSSPGEDTGNGRQHARHEDHASYADANGEVALRYADLIVFLETCEIVRKSWEFVVLLKNLLRAELAFLWQYI